MGKEMGDGAIIRCVQNRRVGEPLRPEPMPQYEPNRCWDASPLTVPQSHGKPARPATVEMQALTTTLCPDRKKYPAGH